MSDDKLVAKIAAAVLRAEKEGKNVVEAVTAAMATGPVFRHVKRGTLYELIHQSARMQHGAVSAVDMQTVVVYRSLADDSIWVRPRKEFFDGRFVRVD